MHIFTEMHLANARWQEITNQSNVFCQWCCQSSGRNNLIILSFMLIFNGAISHYIYHYKTVLCSHSWPKTSKLIFTWQVWRVSEHPRQSSHTNWRQHCFCLAIKLLLCDFRTIWFVSELLKKAWHSPFKLILSNI